MALGLEAEHSRGTPGSQGDNGSAGRSRVGSDASSGGRRSLGSAASRAQAARASADGSTVSVDHAAPDRIGLPAAARSLNIRSTADSGSGSPHLRSVSLTASNEKHVRNTYRKDPCMLADEVKQALCDYHSVRIEKVSPYDAWRVNTASGGPEASYSVEGVLERADWNGLYKRVGMHHNYPRYQRSTQGGNVVVIYFDGMWKLGLEKDTYGEFFFNASKASVPPNGEWVSEDLGTCHVNQSMFSELELVDVFVDGELAYVKKGEVNRRYTPADGDIRKQSLTELLFNGRQKPRWVPCRVTAAGQQPGCFNIRFPSESTSHDEDVDVLGVDSSKIRKGGPQMVERYRHKFGKVMVRDYHSEGLEGPRLRQHSIDHVLTRAMKDKKFHASASSLDSDVSTGLPRRTPASLKNPELSEVFSRERPSLQSHLDKLDDRLDSSKAGNPRAAKKLEVPFWF